MTAKAKTSAFKGVYFHSRTGRWEASVRMPLQQPHGLPGRKVYIGTYADADNAAEAVDVILLKLRGRGCKETNFPAQRYAELLEHLDSLSMQEVMAIVRRRSGSFSWGRSRFRGVTVIADGKWEAHISLKNGTKKETVEETAVPTPTSQQAPASSVSRRPRSSKTIFLGRFSNEMAAARAYDRALIESRGGRYASTNFPMSDYEERAQA